MAVGVFTSRPEAACSGAFISMSWRRTACIGTGIYAFGTTSAPIQPMPRHTLS